MSETFAQFLNRMKQEHPTYHLNYYYTRSSMIENRKRLRMNKHVILDSGYIRACGQYYVKVAKKEPYCSVCMKPLTTDLEKKAMFHKICWES